MKFYSILVAAGLLVSGIAQAQQPNVTVLQPGQSIYVNNYQIITCAGQSLPPMGPQCELKGAGNYNNFKWNYRIAINGNVVGAKDGLDDALTSIKNLEKSSLCSSYAREYCQLMGAGSYNGFNWNYLIGIGNEVVAAKDSQSDALAVIQKLRAANLCY